jgi:diaminohydroxyphosphoribosylaminopyrimidine deaminase/5-amino-6-(5-phosphoribosylamino)uracil reductase
MRDEARLLNAPFWSIMTRHRPFVTLKVALSRDGRMAAAPGVRTALTGAAANRRIHRDRAEVDALAVGSGTILADDPMLTARGAYRERPLTRVVFDSRLRTPTSATLLSTLDAGPVIIVCTPAAAESNPSRVSTLRAAGAEVRATANGLRRAFEDLAGHGISSVIVEGGAMLHRALWDARLVDRVQMYVTPHVLGAEGLQWLPFSVAYSGEMSDVTATIVGDDVLVEGYVHGAD